MKLASLVKTQANRVLGIDASTNSIAFCLMENDKPKHLIEFIND